MSAPLKVPTSAPADSAGNNPSPARKGVTARFRDAVSNFFTEPEPPPQEKSPSVPAIGTPGQPLRVLSFAGGGLDTVMQLGVAHALLVGNSKAPDVVAGVSAGAVNAVALAEILQAGTSGKGIAPGNSAATADPLQSERVAQVSKFRDIFEASVSVPGELLANAAPDPYEVNARAPLKPQELPIHNKEERHERMLAAGARYGLVRLLNSLLSVRLQFSTLTVMSRRILELVQIREVTTSRFHRLRVQVREGFALWWLISSRMIILSPLVFRVLVGVCFGGAYRKLSELEERKAKGTPLSDKNKLLSAVHERVLAFFGLWRADSAKEIITQSKLRRWMLTVLEYLVGGFLALFLFTPLIILTCFAAQFWYPPIHDWLVRNLVAEVWLLGSLFLAFVVVIVTRPTFCGSWALGRLLASFDLEADLLTPFIMKPIFVRMFDRDYYGQGRFEKILNTALQYRTAGQVPTGINGGRTLRHYVENERMPIYVAPAVANIARTHSLGQLEVAGLDEKVVDALLAACAVTPLFRAQELHHTATDAGDEPQYYIDASNVANDPSFVILRQLRRIQSARLKKRDMAIDAQAQREDLTLREGTKGEEISGIEIYPVAPFRVSQGKLGNPDAQDAQPAGAGTPAQPKSFSELVPAALRAIKLRRFQDATLEHKFIHLYCRALPRDKTFFEYETTDAAGKVIHRIAANAVLKPIETDQAASLNIRVLGARDKDSRRTMVAEAVADGCRAALQVMLASRIQEVAGERAREAAPANPSPMKVVRCRDVIVGRVGDGNSLPGSAKGGPPGLPEVCRNCCINRHSEDPGRPRQNQVLEVPSATGEIAPVDWPLRNDLIDPAATQHSAGRRPAVEIVEAKPAKSPVQPGPLAAELCWPRKRDAANDLIQPPELDQSRPTVSFLFSGGVFRGVFQVGVVNALNEAGVRPDLLAGASVGTITSALVGSVFRQPTTAARQAQVAKLAAVFLAIDRLVLTDRFADFFRRFTLRAAEARFSLHDADQFFRRFDQETFGRFNKSARRVVAGLERVFDLNPFELTALTRALRNRETADAWEQLSDHVGQFLDRYGIGQEILGAEPLALLIREVVLSGHHATDSAEFDVFVKEGGFHMVATATNLTQGKLEILSSLPEKPEERVLLKEGLLASSAFPAVFRPRWSWEVHPRASTTDKFVDGGVMDNLPLDAVVHFLWGAYERGLIKLWPETAPHLLFTASLQVHQRELKGDDIRATARNWSRLQARAKRLSYNQKIDRFAEAQQNFRAIAWQRVRDAATARGQKLLQEPGPPEGWRLLNMEAVVVKPEWLVGTFAFNPMLGFRRHLQAASIAHGCATTMRELAHRQQRNPAWAAAWGIQGNLGNPKPPAEAAADDFVTPLPRSAEEQKQGLCWFRKAVCPFSKAHLTSLPDDCRPPQETVDAVQQIYCLCGNPCTHQPDAAKTLRA